MSIERNAKTKASRRENNLNIAPVYKHLAPNGAKTGAAARQRLELNRRFAGLKVQAGRLRSSQCANFDSVGALVGPLREARPKPSCDIPGRSISSVPAQ